MINKIIAFVILAPYHCTGQAPARIHAFEKIISGSADSGLRRNDSLLQVHEVRRGIATLPTVLALMILIVAVAIGITALSFTESLISAGQNNSAQALQYAEAGARDALQRITRNKTYSCTSTTSTYCYSVDFVTNGCSLQAACAQVAVSAGAGTTSTPKVVTSTGIVGSNTRVMQVLVIFDTSTYGQIATTTWTEITQ